MAGVDDVGMPTASCKEPLIRSRPRMTIPAAPSRPDEPARSRLPMALVTWAFIGSILMLVVALVVVKLTEGTAPAVASLPTAQAPASVLAALSGLPSVSFDQAGTGALEEPQPDVLAGQPPLAVDGQVEVAFVGAEFSPYSAAESWALVAALDRFGSFSHLGATSSSSDEIFAATPGFRFDGATYRSTHVALVAVDRYGPTLSTQAPAGFPVSATPSPAVDALLRRYDSRGTTETVLPFVDVGNRLVVVGADFGFSPGLLRGMSMAQVAAALDNPTSAVAGAVLGAADELSAAICAADGQGPPAVCSSPGVNGAATELGIAH